jgi:hypothetical protein
MKKLLFIGMLLAGCGGPKPDCVSTLGTRLFNTTKCDAFEAYQVKVLGAFIPFFGVTQTSVHELLPDLEVVVHDGKFQTRQGLAIGHYEKGHIDLASDDWERSALAHEFAHLIEDAVLHKVGTSWGCSSAEIQDTAQNFASDATAADHCSWARRGVWAKIDSVSFQL